MATAAAATAQANAGSNACLVTFTTIPNGLALVSAANGAALTGRPTTAGAQTVSASVTRYFAHGVTLPLAPITQAFTVRAPVLAYSFSPTPQNAYVVGSDHINLGVRASSSAPATDTCTPTSDQAGAAASFGSSGPLQCYMQWTTLPQGLQATVVNSAPAVTGIPTLAGAQALNWAVTVELPAGPVPLASGSIPLNVVVPGHQFTLNGGSQLPDGTYLAQQTNGMVTQVNLTAAPLGPVDITITDDQGTDTTFPRVSAGSQRSIVAGNFPLWTLRHISVTAAYSNYPTYASSQTLAALEVPYAYAASVYLSVPASVNDTDTVTATVNVGRPGINSSYTFDPATMGSWNVTVDKMNEDGTLTPVAESQSTPTAAGPAQLTFTGISPYDTTLLKLVAIANLVSPLPAYSAKLQSPERAIQVNKGTPIVATLTASTSSGPTPLLVSFGLTMDAANTVALGGIAWQMSVNGGPFTPIANQSGGTLRQVFTDGRTYAVQAVLTNKNSQVTSIAGPVQVVPYLVPTVSVNGPTYAVANFPVTLTAQATIACAVPQSASAWRRYLSDRPEPHRLVRGHARWQHAARNRCDLPAHATGCRIGRDHRARNRTELQSGRHARHRFGALLTHRGAGSQALGVDHRAPAAGDRSALSIHRECSSAMAHPSRQRHDRRPMDLARRQHRSRNHPDLDSERVHPERGAPIHGVDRWTAIDHLRASHLELPGLGLPIPDLGAAPHATDHRRPVVVRTRCAKPQLAAREHHACAWREL